MDVRKLDQEQLKMADAATKWWLGLKPEQQQGYLVNIERHLNKTYKSHRVVSSG